jgi:hypothetical protein
MSEDFVMKDGKPTNLKPTENRWEYSLVCLTRTYLGFLEDAAKENLYLTDPDILELKKTLENFYISRNVFFKD